MITEKQREYNRKYRETHRDEIEAKRKIYYQNNKEKLHKKQKEWRDRNKEKIKIKQLNYRKNNKEKLAEAASIRLKAVKDFTDSQKSYSHLYSQLKSKYKNAATLKESDIIELDKLKNKRDAYYELRKKIQIYLKKPGQNVYDEFDLPHFS